RRSRPRGSRGSRPSEPEGPARERHPEERVEQEERGERERQREDGGEHDPLALDDAEQARERERDGRPVAETLERERGEGADGEDRDRVPPLGEAHAREGRRAAPRSTGWSPPSMPRAARGAWRMKRRLGLEWVSESNQMRRACPRGGFGIAAGPSGLTAQPWSSRGSVNGNAPPPWAKQIRRS